MIPVERTVGCIRAGQRQKARTLENGAALRAALDKITDAGPTKQYLVKLEPGTYDVGSTPLTMKSFIFLQGFGPDDTKITGNVEGHSGGEHPTSGVVICADFTVLVDLEVENTGGVTKAVAVFNKDIPTFFRMTHLNVLAEGGTTSNYGVYNENSAVTMENVDAEASGGTNGYGVYNVNSSPNMDHMNLSSRNATNNYGVYNTSSSEPKMKSCDGFSYWWKRCIRRLQRQFLPRVDVCGPAGRWGDVVELRYLS